LDHYSDTEQPGRLPRTARHLVVGAGQLGRALERALTELRYPVRLIARRELDLAEPRAFDALTQGETIDVVWLTAAVTGVDWCEANESAAMLVNAEAPGVIAEICAARGVRLVHFSTDYVFSGRHGDAIRNEPYREDDTPEPLSVYGASKLEGERRVLGANPGATVVRTSGLYSVDGKCFFNAILEKARLGEPVHVVDDQITSPTYADELAEWLARRFDQLPPGIVHLAASGGVSWQRAAEAAFELAGIGRGKVIGITSAEIARPAQRPAYSVLGSRILPELALSPVANWLEGLARWAVDKTGVRPT
jgi:dTDP-4-dehydrorhamnose reductase